MAGTAQISQYPAISDPSFYFPKVALHQSFVERTSRKGGEKGGWRKGGVEE